MMMATTTNDDIEDWTKRVEKKRRQEVDNSKEALRISVQIAASGVTCSAWHYAKEVHRIGRQVFRSASGSVAVQFSFRLRQGRKRRLKRRLRSDNRCVMDVILCVEHTKGKQGRSCCMLVEIIFWVANFLQCQFGAVKKRVTSRSASSCYVVRIYHGARLGLTRHRQGSTLKQFYE